MRQPKLPFSLDSLSPDLKDTSLWPIVDVSRLKESYREVYRRREYAILACLEGVSRKRIREEFGITRHEVRRLLLRCIEDHPDGRLWGFRGLVPYCQQKTRERELGQLFDQFPHLRELVETLFYKILKKGIVHESRIPVRAIHKKLLDACRALGLNKRNRYPFSTERLGYVALWKYLRKLFDKNQSRATRARYGEDAARNLRMQNNITTQVEKVSRPFQRVEFDGHRLDVFCTIVIPSPIGRDVELVLGRFWLLAIIDCYTRCILGYHLCFQKEYSGDDVLLCAAKAIVPWKPKELTINALKYPETGGFPSAVFEEAKWALWDEFACDNAKANLSDRVRKRMISVVGCSIVAGAVKNPVSRAIIERFFQTLEQYLHRLPSTAGSGIGDSRRHKPEEAALKHQISLAHIEELIDVAIAEYNGTPHSGIGHLSPLECMQKYLHSNALPPRQVLEQQRNNLELLNIEETRKVVGNRKKGTAPHVNFAGERYSNDVLSHSYHLLGKPLHLIADPEQGRFVRAFLPNGMEFGILSARGVWGRVPHTLLVRKMTLALRKKREIHYLEHDDPVQIVMDYYGKKAITSKDARRKYLIVAGSRKRNKQGPVASAAQLDIEGPPTEPEHDDDAPLLRTIEY